MKVFTTMTSAAALLSAVPAAAKTCTVAPSCADLGYTESVADCNGSKYITCPFDATKVTCITPTPAVGDLKYSWQTKDHDGWLLCNGRTISSSTYPQLYALVGTTLPNYSGYFLKGASVTSTSTFKTAQAAGLPNITGDVSLQGAEYNGSTSSSGAMSISAYSNYGSGHNSSGSSTKITFNASKSNSIYGKSTTVTPQNYSANVFIYAGKSDVCGDSGYVASTAGMYGCTSVKVGTTTCYKGCKSSQLLEQCKQRYDDLAYAASTNKTEGFRSGCYSQAAHDCSTSIEYYTTSDVEIACKSVATDLVKYCYLDVSCMSDSYSESPVVACGGILCDDGYYCSSGTCTKTGSSSSGSSSTGGSTADSCSCDPDRDSACSC